MSSCQRLSIPRLPSGRESAKKELPFVNSADLGSFFARGVAFPVKACYTEIGIVPKYEKAG